MTTDITFCTYFDCKFFNKCRRYVYTLPDEENVSVCDFHPHNEDSKDPKEYCEFYYEKRY